MEAQRLSNLYLNVIVRLSRDWRSTIHKPYKETVSASLYDVDLPQNNPLTMLIPTYQTITH